MTPEEVVRLWDVGRVGAVTPRGGGSINGAFRVRAEAGSLHLRVYRSPDRARVEREHAAISLALCARVATPAVLPTRAGRPFAAVGETWAALFHEAAGAPIPRGELTPNHAAALGTFLAELHDRLPVSPPLEVPELHPASVERTVERLERIEAALLTLMS